MGLDMYLNKKTYVQNWDHRPEKYKISVKLDGKVVEHIKPERIVYIEERVGEWRKANAIHKWFVDNIQGGDDDCGTYYVDRDSMLSLLDNVNTVLNNPQLSSELLPCQDGFFFGSTEYDEYYLEDLRKTKTILETALEDNNGDYYYTSSW